MFRNLCLIKLLTIATLCNAERYVTLQKKSGYNGPLIASLTFYSSTPDVEEFAPGIVQRGGPDRICAKGLWLTYSETGYNGTVKPHPNQNEWKDELCLNADTIRSFRSVGLDVEEKGKGEGLTIFSEENYEGHSFRVEGPANAHLPFAPKSLLVSGFKSQWTLYKGTNFNGSATCYGDTEGYYQYVKVSPLYDVGSIVPGCHRSRGEDQEAYQMEII